MNIGIIVNGSRDPEGIALFKVINLLNNYDVTPIVDGRRLPESLYIKINAAGIGIHDVNLSCDFVITLGGDGTVLDAAQKVAKYNIPLIAINTGHLGYLTIGNIEGLDKIINRLMSKEYIIEKRMMTDARIYDIYIENKTMTGLNEVVITKANYAVNTIRINLYEILPPKGRYTELLLVNKYTADGLIISTPTGSTAYSLSAGGPILKPNSEMLAITPLNPHNLNNRPFVIPADVNLRIEIESNSEEAHAVVDGIPFYNFKNSNMIDIKRSEYYTSLVKMDADCYSILRNKMM